MADYSVLRQRPVASGVQMYVDQIGGRTPYNASGVAAFAANPEAATSKWASSRAEAWNLRNPESDFIRGAKRYNEQLAASQRITERDEALIAAQKFREVGDFAAETNALAKAKKAEAIAYSLLENAEQFAPRVAGTNEITPRNFIDYAQDITGTIAPLAGKQMAAAIPASLAAGAATTAMGLPGAGTVATLAGTAAGAIQSYKDISSLNTMDFAFNPDLQHLTPQERKEAARKLSLQQSAVEIIPGGIVASQVGRLWKGAKQAEKQAERANKLSSFLKTYALTSAGEGAEEGVQELLALNALDQYAPNRDRSGDRQQLVDALVAGVVGGAGMGAITGTTGLLSKQAAGAFVPETDSSEISQEEFQQILGQREQQQTAEVDPVYGGGEWTFKNGELRNTSDGSQYSLQTNFDALDNVDLSEYSEIFQKQSPLQETIKSIAPDFKDAEVVANRLDKLMALSFSDQKILENEYKDKKVLQTIQKYINSLDLEDDAKIALQEAVATRYSFLYQQALDEFGGRFAGLGENVLKEAVRGAFDEDENSRFSNYDSVIKPSDEILEPKDELLPTGETSKANTFESLEAAWETLEALVEANLLTQEQASALNVRTVSKEIEAKLVTLPEEEQMNYLRSIMQEISRSLGKNKEAFKSVATFTENGAFKGFKKGATPENIIEAIDNTDSSLSMISIPSIQNPEGGTQSVIPQKDPVRILLSAARAAPDYSKIDTKTLDDRLKITLPNGKELILSASAVAKAALYSDNVTLENSSPTQNAGDALERFITDLQYEKNLDVEIQNPNGKPSKDNWIRVVDAIQDTNVNDQKYFFKNLAKWGGELRPSSNINPLRESATEAERVVRENAERKEEADKLRTQNLEETPVDSNTEVQFRNGQTVAEIRKKDKGFEYYVDGEKTNEVSRWVDQNGKTYQEIPDPKSKGTVLKVADSKNSELRLPTQEEIETWKARFQKTGTLSLVHDQRQFAKEIKQRRERIQKGTDVRSVTEVVKDPQINGRSIPKLPVGTKNQAALSGTLLFNRTELDVVIDQQNERQQTAYERYKAANETIEKKNKTKGKKSQIKTPWDNDKYVSNAYVAAIAKLYPKRQLTKAEKVRAELKTAERIRKTFERQERDRNKSSKIQKQIAWRNFKAIKNRGFRDLLFGSHRVRFDDFISELQKSLNPTALMKDFYSKMPLNSRTLEFFIANKWNLKDITVEDINAAKNYIGAYEKIIANTYKLRLLSDSLAANAELREGIISGLSSKEERLLFNLKKSEKNLKDEAYNLTKEVLQKLVFELIENTNFENYQDARQFIDILLHGAGELESLNDLETALELRHFDDLRAEAEKADNQQIETVQKTFLAKLERDQNLRVVVANPPRNELNADQTKKFSSALKAIDDAYALSSKSNSWIKWSGPKKQNVQQQAKKVEDISSETLENLNKILQDLYSLEDFVTTFIRSKYADKNLIGAYNTLVAVFGDPNLENLSVPHAIIYAPTQLPGSDHVFTRVSNRLGIPLVAGLPENTKVKEFPTLKRSASTPFKVFTKNRRITALAKGQQKAFKEVRAEFLEGVKIQQYQEEPGYQDEATEFENINVIQYEIGEVGSKFFVEINLDVFESPRIPGQEGSPSAAPLEATKVIKSRVRRNIEKITRELAKGRINLAIRADRESEGGIFKGDALKGVSYDDVVEAITKKLSTLDRRHQRIRKYVGDFIKSDDGKVFIEKVLKDSKEFVEAYKGTSSAVQKAQQNKDRAEKRLLDPDTNAAIELQKQKVAALTKKVSQTEAELKKASSKKKKAKGTKLSPAEAKERNNEAAKKRALRKVLSDTKEALKNAKAVLKSYGAELRSYENVLTKAKRLKRFIYNGGQYDITKTLHKLALDIDRLENDPKKLSAAEENQLEKEKELKEIQESEEKRLWVEKEKAAFKYDTALKTGDTNAIKTALNEATSAWNAYINHVRALENLELRNTEKINRLQASLNELEQSASKAKDVLEKRKIQSKIESLKIQIGAEQRNFQDFESQSFVSLMADFRALLEAHSRILKTPSVLREEGRVIEVDAKAFDEILTTQSLPMFELLNDKDLGNWAIPPGTFFTLRRKDDAKQKRVKADLKVLYEKARSVTRIVEGQPTRKELPPKTEFNPDANTAEQQKLQAKIKDLEEQVRDYANDVTFFVAQDNVLLTSEDVDAILKIAYPIEGIPRIDALKNVLNEGDFTPKSAIGRAVQALTASVNEAVANPFEKATYSEEQIRAAAAEDVPEGISQFVINPERYSLQTNKNKGRKQKHSSVKSVNINNAEQWIQKVLGDHVEFVLHTSGLIDGVAGGKWSPLDGETKQAMLQVSMAATDPLGTVFHEATHDLAATLRTSPSGQVIYNTLKRLASKPYMRRELNRIYKAHPEVIKQMKNSTEERIAYMTQAYLAGELRSLENKNIGYLRKFAQTIFKLLGWIGKFFGHEFITLGQAGENILTSFAEGKLAKTNFRGRAEVAQMLKQKELANKFPYVQKLLSNMYKVFQSPITRLRALEHPALTAALRHWYSMPEDQNGVGLGSLQARQQETNLFMNQWSDLWKNVDPLQEEEILFNLQSMKEAKEGSPEYKIRKFLDEIFEYMKDAGVKVQEYNGEKWVWRGIKKEDLYFPRVWDDKAILNNETRFKELMLKHGKEQYILDSNGKTRKLDETYIDGFIEAVKLGDGMHDLKNLGFHNPANASINPRVFTFITPDNASEFAEFQNQDIQQIIGKYIYQAVHRAEHVRRWGYDSGGLKSLLAELEKDLTTAEYKEALKSIEALEGTLGANTWGERYRHVMTGIMSVVNWSVLPLAIFSSMAEPMLLAVRSGRLSDAWGAYKHGIKEVIRDKRKKKLNSEASDLAAMIGIIERNIGIEVAHNYMNNAHMSATMSKLNYKFFRAIGLEGWTRGMRIAATEAGISYLKRHKNDKQRLKELNLEPGDINFKKDGSLKLHFADGISKSQEKKLQQALFMFVDGAVLRPNAAQRPVFMSDPRFMLLGHLKQFTFSFHHTINKRVWKNIKESVENGTNSVQKATAIAMHLAPLIGTIPILMAAQVVRDLVSGASDDRDRTWPEAIWMATQRGGIFGAAGSIGQDLYDDFDRSGSPANTILGPSVTKLSNLGLAMFSSDRKFFSELAGFTPGHAAIRNWEPFE